MRSLAEVKSFGGTAAEDDDIERFFVKTPTFSELTSGEKHLVLGRKGSGKTALYLAMMSYSQKEGRAGVGLSFRQYPWAAHSKYVAPDLDRGERYVASWTFLILCEVFSILSARKPDDLTRQQSIALGQVQKFLQRNYGTTRLDFKSLFPAGGLHVEGLDISTPGTRVGGSGTLRTKKRSEALGATLSRVNDWMMEKLAKIGSRIPDTFVLFDELDLGFDASSEQYKERIIGLLIAVRSFISDVTRRNIPIHPIVFLRTDIFEQLHFGDRNKIKTHDATELAWHDRLTHEGASLKHLIDWRIKEELGVDDIEEAWGNAFDPQLTRGTQHKFQHMTFRTFLRPRDVIQFANLALAEAKKRSNSEAWGHPLLITNDDLKAARVPYSNYFRDELDDEISAVDASWQRLLDILRRVGSARFLLEEYSTAYEFVTNRSPLELTVEDSLGFLYRYSIIGFERAITGAGIIHQFKYQDEAVSFEADAASFLVHRALKETLGLTET